MRRLRRVLLWTLFGLYCALMLWLLLFRRLGRTMPGEYAALLHTNCNLTPLRTIRSYLLVLRRSSSPTMRLFTLLGSCDVDDLLLNLLGVLLGWGLLRLFSRGRDAVN